MKNLPAIIILLILFCLPGYTQRGVKKPYLVAKKYEEGIFLAELAQSEQFERLIDHVEAKISKGEDLTTEQMFWLCTSYEALCNYDKLYSRIDLFEEMIRNGESMFYNNDMSVYPYIYRARYFQAISDFHKAIDEALEGIELLHKDGRQFQSLYRYQLINLLGIIGTSQALLGEYDSSQEAVQRISEISLAESNIGPEKYAAMARIHMANRDFDKALTAISDPRATVNADIAQYYNTSFQDLPKLFIYYKCLFEQDRFSDAEKGYDFLLNHVNIEQMGSMYWILLLDRAKIYRAKGEYEQAIKSLKAAVDVTEKIRSSIRTEAGRIGFVEDKQMIYQELISLLMQMGQHEEAFFYVERSKARTLVDLLGSVHSFRIQDRSLSESEEILDRFDKAESEMIMSRNMGDTAGVQRSIGIWQNHKKQLLTEAPELDNLVTISPVQVKTIQSMLFPGESILEYYYAGNMLYIFVLDQGSVHARMMDIQTVHLEASIHFFRSRISTPDSEEYMKSARMLYDLLIKPVASELEGKDVIIVPHGILHYLPFIALHSGESFLLENLSIRYLPSAEILRFLHTGDPYSLSRCLILGNPDLGDPAYELEYAEKEAASIAEFFAGSELRTGAEATETIVKTEGDQYNILHFANHGIFLPGNPLQSSLLLARDQFNDGQLTASELYTLKLNADLVTLSACESGLGDISSGDDVIGFTRGLLFAGAHSIVSSLWSVDDRSTSELMICFYQNLENMTRNEALRKAQMETMKKYGHPFFWAPFILIGNKN